MRARFIIIAALAVISVSGRAWAYPQFQLAKDQTCGSCHIAPEGGGLLNENGLNTADQISAFGTDPAFFNGAFGMPSWLAASGDFRGASGFVQSPQKYLTTFPMQADLYASAKFLDNFRVTVTVGYRPPENGNETATSLWSREHYVLWQQHKDDQFGFFARVGRFMPIFGLRFAEHPEYTRQYGGTQLYSETYGAAVEYIDPKWEAHLTGFIKDPLIDPVAHDNGVAAYGEWRPTEHASVGLEGMYTFSDDDSKYRGGVTGKYYVPAADLNVEGEVQFVNQHIAGYGLNQVVGTVMATKFLPGGVMADLALNYYNENIRIRGVDRDAIDLNIHWFTTSHVELLLTNRLEFIHFGDSATSATSGPLGSYAMVQAHYRL
jgi:hypothetical protein